ncbi:MAG TPA: hypothetical protein PKA33_15925 [Amaricoccus sp.]|uniref:hypothetical protein n=1 Tax=Amaricoccus sp. TaxID=1872485 RepID=UPI002BC0B405|nr:hypothetical protein [Amaricoccus sp.]HMQ92508.1 hypothetical protein [Amaricoccus sp.]HMR53843.1 hypothetical protein [Amaricoccus sp.]HMR58960.1 hypothetical protein [Amaricoccus sp.]HMU00838.1 hypothetical protein [Amaricoccus sp.]
MVDANEETRVSTIKEEFHVVMHCPRCGHVVDAWPEEVPVADTSTERASDGEATIEIELDCKTCAESFSATIRAHLGGWEVFLTDDPSQTGTFEHFDYHYDEWIDELEPELHPRGIFDASMQEWRLMLNNISDDRYVSAGNRMLLVQLFSILEAYLSDAVVNLAHGDQKVVAAIIKWHPELKGANVSLARVAAEPDLARNIVVAQLRKMQFHRFEFVNGMLRAAIGHHLLPGEKAARDLVLKSTRLRHACVHGNGRDQDGKYVAEVTPQYLSVLADHFSDIVTRLAFRIDEGGEKRQASGLESLFRDPFDQRPGPDAASPAPAARP